MSIMAFESQSVFDEANKLYSKTDFVGAAKLYEQIVNEGYGSKELYYNLGNAYYKQGKIGLTILNYEKALKLDPNDEDVKYNLKIARLKIQDKIEDIPQLFLTEWKQGFVNSIGETAWSWVCIICMLLFCVALALYNISRRIEIRQTSFWLALVFAVCFITTFFIARSSFKQLDEGKNAVVLASSVNVSSSPDETGTRLFVLHEGTKVAVLQQNDTWAEVKLANGNTGWLNLQSIEVF